ncbi:MCE family protein [Gordonia sp. TBRC 11910]|uniref:MCE family protein n=1 Tax=Gordonia asplenii TaxID=2725283 RepID=A0A848L1A3_9ACTN|nr:MCE family protein [Gordonia asplenii]NMO04654.1 MCE family protein [Gordonia asplenii]
MTTPDLTGTSGPGRWFTPRHIVMLVFGIILALIVGSVLWWLFSGLGSTTVNATFKRAVGIYAGSDVRILGVNVGKVDKVTPDGDKVHVKMTVQRGVTLPADVRALEVVPSVVADRFVQLAPAYSGGEKAGRDITLTENQTMVPVEVDDLYANLQKLSKALGPNGVNKNGALNALVQTGADNLKGNGAQLGEAITNLSKASTTLSDSSGNLVDTIKNLNVFVGALRANDDQVRQFNAQMASFTSFMAGERQQLGLSLNKLSIALGDVAGFIEDNQQSIGDTVRSLQPTTKALADNKEHLKEIFTVLPTTINNLINAYDAESGTLAMRLTINQLQQPIKAMCNLLNLGNLMPGNPSFVQFSNAIRPFLSQCEAIGTQIQKGVLEPVLPVLPFGIMSNDKTQKYPVPGTRGSNPDPNLKVGPGSTKAPAAKPSTRGGN